MPSEIYRDISYLQAFVDDCDREKMDSLSCLFEAVGSLLYHVYLPIAHNFGSFVCPLY